MSSSCLGGGGGGGWRGGGRGGGHFRGGRHALGGRVCGSRNGGLERLRGLRENRTAPRGLLLEAADDRGFETLGEVGASRPQRPGRLERDLEAELGDRLAF